MNDEVSRLKDKFQASLYEASIYNGIVHFSLKKQDNYYDAILRATFDLSYGYNDVVLLGILSLLILKSYTQVRKLKI